MRNELPSKEKPINTASEGVMVDVLQQYDDISATQAAFPNLPSDVQVPNASNSVDARKYGRELMQYYRDGNGTFLGQMVFSKLPMFIEAGGIEAGGAVD